jgi:hypothetical protein
MLMLNNIPEFIRVGFVIIKPKQKQVGQHCDPHEVCAALFVPADLVLAQFQAQYHFPIHELNPSMPLVNAQHRSDITDVTQTQASAIPPKGLAHLAYDVIGSPDALVQRAGHMGGEQFLCHPSNQQMDIPISGCQEPGKRQAVIVAGVHLVIFCKVLRPG